MDQFHQKECQQQNKLDLLEELDNQVPINLYQQYLTLVHSTQDLIAAQQLHDHRQ